MTRSARYGNILALFLLAVFIIIGSIFAINIFAAQDAAVNVTGTAYENSYNSSQSIQESFVSILPLGGYLLIVVAVILIIGVIRKH